ncbi:S8 family serine peptidase [Rheinheimera sp. UJ63]|uniref:S8 family serine peptidase n=1 Tax=Rheinheimera sp. UJ63 TaxID=2910157 RepID=UPI001F16CE86|nr:S8 family serine peptidase [Rheinheimera sp. UJ63]MCF4010859.1 S8 family serine peptidase [Rheinheimera sp. UJ63]
MKNLVIILIFSFFGVVKAEPVSIEYIHYLDAQPKQHIDRLQDSNNYRLIVKFKNNNIHHDLLQTPETNQLLLEQQGITLSNNLSLLQKYNVAQVGDRNRGLLLLHKIAQNTGIVLKHVRSSALGADVFLANSLQEQKDTIAALMQTGLFNYVHPDLNVTNAEFHHQPAKLPNANNASTNAFNRDLFDDPLYLKEGYLDEQQQYTMGSHSLLKASLYAQDNNKLGRKVRIAVIDTGSFPHEDVVWSNEGADFISGFSNEYSDCKKQDNTHNGADSICTVDNYLPKSRDQDPIDKAWKFTLDQDGNPTADGDIRIDGHGLKVASTIAAKRNNGKGIIGGLASENVELIPVRALLPSGGRSTDVSDAIVWAAGGDVPGMPNISSKVDIINLSLGGFSILGCESSSYIEAIEFARSQNVLIVGAAGNDGKDVRAYTPGACPGVLTVGANNLEGDLTGFSNYGEEVEVTFEGANVHVATINTSIYLDAEKSGFCGLDSVNKTNQNCYGEVSGTSFSAPLASATAAIVKMVQSDLDESQIRALIANTAPLYVEKPSGQRTTRASLMPFAGVGNAYSAVTTNFDSVSLNPVQAKHRYANFNNAVEQRYIAALITNSSRDAICEAYDLTWGAYREEISGVSYQLYASNSNDAVLTENNSQVLQAAQEPRVTNSALVNIAGFKRIAVQAVVNGAASELAEFDLTQASMPVSCI